MYFLIFVFQINSCLMKHKILLLTIFLLFGFQTFAQLKPFRFGVKAAPNISWISPDTKDYETDGPVIGVFMGYDG